MPQLVLPNSKYKQSFLEAVAEYQQEKLPIYLPLNIQELDANFEKYIDDLRNEAHGLNLPEDYVPHTVFWLVEGETFIGRVDIRHKLNEYLKHVGGHIGYDIRPSKRNMGYGTTALRLALEEARKIGILEVLITCDATNIGSNKIIQKNGGELLPSIQSGHHPSKNRYIITTYL